MVESVEEAEIRQAETDWNTAIRAQNIALARTFMEEDYVLVGVRSTGSNTVKRETWLQNLAAMRLDSYRAEVARVRVYGDAAVVSVEGDWRLGFHGREIEESFFLTDVWHRCPEGWKVVLRHSSPYPKPETTS